MQTFLPFRSFTASAQVLDYRRLGKQRVECKQLLSALRYEVRDGILVATPDSKAGWQNHPAAKMWRGYEMALAEYQLIMIQEWIQRGYKNTIQAINPSQVGDHYPDPPWLGDEAFHASHRSNLLRKDPKHYGQFGWTESPDLEYVWPVP
jgi:hypothetical protein